MMGHALANPTDATHLLITGRRGHKQAVDALVPQIFDELKQIAHRLLQKRPADGVLDTTALVHEAYLKLIDQSRVEWSDRAHFQALAARAMRQILINRFHRQRAAQRGGALHRVTFEEGKIPLEQRGTVVLALDDALTALEQVDERLARLVLYRFFGGMSHKAIADVLDVSPRTIRRDWQAAKAWLARWLNGRASV